MDNGLGNTAFPDALGGWFWVYILGPIIDGVFAHIVFQYFDSEQN